MNDVFMKIESDWQHTQTLGLCEVSVESVGRMGFWSYKYAQKSHIDIGCGDLVSVRSASAVRLDECC